MDRPMPTVDLESYDWRSGRAVYICRPTGRHLELARVSGEQAERLRPVIAEMFANDELLGELRVRPL